MSMPEAAVHKHGNLFLWEHEIGMALYWVVSPPTCDSVLLEYFNQPQFRGLVLFGLDLPHDVRPLFRIKNICHDKSPGFKFYAEAGVSLRFQHNLVISFDDARERRVPLGLVKEAMFIDVCRQELLNVPYFDAPGQTGVLGKIESGMYALKNRDDNGMATGAEVSPALFDQQRARHGRAMNNRVANDKVAVAIRRAVGYGSTVDFKRIFRKNQAKFRCHKMLQHCAEILCSGVLLLTLFRLIK